MAKLGGSNVSAVLFCFVFSVIFFLLCPWGEGERTLLVGKTHQRQEWGTVIDGALET